ncbi:MAG: rhomboid family intramembrane serine protease [Phycisphaeraceae bacterium]|nr:rhomboid family intramembrane serine protease [Phycisphaeraceae bacterium]
MGIYDRQYSRQSMGGFGRRGGLGAGFSANTWLMIINIGVFVLMAMNQTAARTLGEYGHFSTHHVIWHSGGGLEFWRFLTFQFLHADIWHIFFNMLGLYMFGSMVEQHLGSRRYLAFYLTCGVFGGLMYFILNVLGTVLLSMGMKQVPVLLFTDVKTPLIGASAGVFGVIMACAYIAPNVVVQLIFPPIPMRLKIMAYAYVGLALANLIFGGNNAGGDAAHIGGAIAGYFFIRHAHLLRDFFDVFSNSRKGTKSRARVSRIDPPRSSPARPQAASRPSDQEVDRILAKVRAEGLQSLSVEEKETLRKATDSSRSAGRG